MKAHKHTHRNNVHCMYTSHVCMFIWEGKKGWRNNIKAQMCEKQRWFEWCSLYRNRRKRERASEWARRWKNDEKCDYCLMMHDMKWFFRFSSYTQLLFVRNTHMWISMKSLNSIRDDDDAANVNAEWMLS